ncbi:MAG: nicotinic acid mononucleotide adenyltransferase [Flavobacteriaceae bacterium]|nr:nicotinic acid mononucleotide adenyltransferase [Flavobacteriaceae bacterium]
MKKTMLLLVMFFAANMVFAQECSKKNSYVFNGDVIEATLYHDNGAVAQTGFYTQDNKLHGKWISYDVQGNKTAVASYENGEKIGTWLFYDGSTMKEVTYTSSKIAEVKTWTNTETRVVAN